MHIEHSGRESVVILGEVEGASWGSEGYDEGEMEAFADVARADTVQEAVEPFVTAGRAECDAENCCLTAVEHGDAREFGDSSDPTAYFDRFPISVITVSCERSGCDNREGKEKVAERIGAFAQAAIDAKEKADAETDAIMEPAQQVGSERVAEAERIADELIKNARSNANERTDEIYAETREAHYSSTPTTAA